MASVSCDADSVISDTIVRVMKTRYNMTFVFINIIGTNIGVT